MTARDFALAAAFRRAHDHILLVRACRGVDNLGGAKVHLSGLARERKRIRQMRAAFRAVVS